LIDGVQLTLAPCLDDFRIRCAPVLIEQFGVTVKWCPAAALGAPKSLDEYRDKNHSSAAI